MRNFSQVSPEFGRRLTEALAKFQTVGICNRLNPYGELIFIAWMNIYFYYDLLLNPPVGKVKRILCFDWLLCTWAGKISFISKDVFERRTSTGSGLFSFLSGIFAQIFGQIVPIIGKRPRKTYLVLSIYFKMKKMSLPVDVRCSKTPLIDLPNDQARSVKMTGYWLRSFLLLCCHRPHGS